jgi:hypothetical protein
LSPDSVPTSSLLTEDFERNYYDWRIIDQYLNSKRGKYGGDVESIEVLRVAQGVLFDRNVTGGKDESSFLRPTFVLKTGNNVDNTRIMEHAETKGDGALAWNPGGKVQAKPFTSAQNHVGYNNVIYNSATLETNIGVGLGNGRVTNIACYRDVKLTRSTKTIFCNYRDTVITAAGSTRERWVSS